MTTTTMTAAFALATMAAVAAQRTMAAGMPDHGALQEVWTGIPGETVDALTSSPRFALVPDQVRILTNASSVCVQEEMGGRTTALLEPPESGTFTFWLASDDAGELWLGTNDSPATARLIARVAEYTGKNQWNKEPGQKSAPVALEKGRKYFMRVLVKQGGGDAHFSVGWQCPGFTRTTVIPGSCLTLPPVGEGLGVRIALTRKTDEDAAKLQQKVIAMIESGTILPADLTMKIRTLSKAVPPTNDTGISVLLDQAHQTSFAILWEFSEHVRTRGFRCCTSIASLGSVLKKGGVSRIRQACFGCEPFAWYPNPTFNVVITTQADVAAQPYTAIEIAALKAFVEEGGGLLIIPGVPNGNEAKTWSMHNLLAAFGAQLTTNAVTAKGIACATFTLDPTWTAMTTVDSVTVQAGRPLGKGRVMLWSSFDFITSGEKETNSPNGRQLDATLKWLAAGTPPAGGEWGLGGAGGVGIFPELEKDLKLVRVLYSANQPRQVLDCIDNDLTKASVKVLEWLPTPMNKEPYYIVICAGGGGGWAIEGRPKVAAVIEYEPLSILGVFGHEMAHTLEGPPNDLGQYAGWSPHVNGGESHAGWFQGKIGAFFSGETNKSNRDCNDVYQHEIETGKKIDIAHPPEGDTSWGKEWYIFNKLDDKYGPTWYPRWYWVRSTRWKDEPAHQETWDEMVEDISIAVGEDLFPFFRKVGTTLAKNRLARIEFNGQMLDLPVAELPDGPAGPVCLAPIGDYKKPLPKKK